MRQIDSIKQIKDIIFKNFPVDWIDGLDWTDNQNSENSLRGGIASIKDAEDKLFVAFAKIGLQGDHLRLSSKDLDYLMELCDNEIVEDDSNEFKAKLQTRFRHMIDCLKNAILLAKHHIYITSELFTVRDARKKIMNFIQMKSSSASENSWIVILDTIFDVCLFEYRFTYNQKHIRQLLIKRKFLKDSRSVICTSEAEMIVSLVISKIDFLLLKLSHFAQNKRIEYQFNFEKTVVCPDIINQNVKEQYACYLKFIEPNTYISNIDVYQWQCHPKKKWAKLGQMVLLMRYYTKVTRDRQQANNLLSEYEAFYNEKQKEVFYEFNKYALRSVRIYMHNCLLSLKCKQGKDYTFEDLKEDMNYINTIQNECFIFNYYPYQKAIEYAIKSINQDLSRKAEKTDLLEKIDLLRAWQINYHNNIEWCEENQCYAFQLTFNECTDIDKSKNTKVFYPSSFSRPLKFSEIYRKKEALDFEIMRLTHEVDRYDDVLALKEAHAKVENMERKNMEMMGLFITLTTFLVGLLSIFIGNHEKISIFEKMQYVIMLGSILLMFVCLGYFLIGNAAAKYKPYIFGLISVILLASICFYFYTLAVN